MQQLLMSCLSYKIEVVEGINGNSILTYTGNMSAGGRNMRYRSD